MLAAETLAATLPGAHLFYFLQAFGWTWKYEDAKRELTYAEFLRLAAEREPDGDVALWDGLRAHSWALKAYADIMRLRHHPALQDDHDLVVFDNPGPFVAFARPHADHSGHELVWTVTNYSGARQQGRIVLSDQERSQIHLEDTAVPAAERYFLLYDRVHGELYIRTAEELKSFEQDLAPWESRVYFVREIGRASEALVQLRKNLGPVGIPVSEKNLQTILKDLGWRRPELQTSALEDAKVMDWNWDRKTEGHSLAAGAALRIANAADFHVHAREKGALAEFSAPAVKAGDHFEISLSGFKPGTDYEITFNWPSPEGVHYKLHVGLVPQPALEPSDTLAAPDGEARSELRRINTAEVTAAARSVALATYPGAKGQPAPDLAQVTQAYRLIGPSAFEEAAIAQAEEIYAGRQISSGAESLETAIRHYLDRPSQNAEDKTFLHFHWVMPYDETLRPWLENFFGVIEKLSSQEAYRGRLSARLALVTTEKQTRRSAAFFQRFERAGFVQRIPSQRGSFKAVNDFLSMHDNAIGIGLAQALEDNVARSQRFRLVGISGLTLRQAFPLSSTLIFRTAQEIKIKPDLLPQLPFFFPPGMLAYDAASGRLRINELAERFALEASVDKILASMA